MNAFGSVESGMAWLLKTSERLDTILNAHMNSSTLIETSSLLLLSPYALYGDSG